MQRMKLRKKEVTFVISPDNVGVKLTHPDETYAGGNLGSHTHLVDSHSQQERAAEINYVNQYPIASSIIVNVNSFTGTNNRDVCDFDLGHFAQTSSSCISNENSSAPQTPQPQSSLPDSTPRNQNHQDGPDFDRSNVTTDQPLRRSRGRPKKQNGEPATSEKSNGAHRFTCSKCSKSFTTLIGLRRHEFKLSHSGNAIRFRCEDCDLTFSRTETLRAHRSIMHEGTSVDHQCHLCPKKYTRNHALKLHLENQHAVEKERLRTLPNRDAKRTKLQCSICKTILREQHMKSHMLILHPPFSSTGKLQAQEFQFLPCPTNLSRADHLEEQANVHTSVANNPELNQVSSGLKCSVCKETLPSLSSLKLHKCYSEYIHQCHYCSKKFRKEDNLNRHIDGHLNFGTFKSKYCERRYHARVGMLNHDKGHAEKGVCCGSDQFVAKQCKLCPDKVLTPALVVKHFIDKHHRECSVSVRRLEANPISITSGNLEPNSYVLCNICGNCYSKPDYRLHCVLSEKCKYTDTESNDGAVTEDIDENFILNQEQDMVSEVDATTELFPDLVPVEVDANEGHEQDSATASFFPEIGPFKEITADMVNFSDIEAKPDLYDGYNSPNSDEKLEPEDLNIPNTEETASGKINFAYPAPDENEVKPEMVELNVNVENQEVCKLCETIIPKSCLIEHFRDKHSQQVSVSVNRMLFKQQKRTLRGLVMVKPCYDTFHIPWYLCCKCSRTFTSKHKAYLHTKLSCPLKDYYVAIPLNPPPRVSMNPSAAVLEEECTENILNTTENWKETWNDSFLRRDNWANLVKINYPEIKLTKNGKFQCSDCGKEFTSKVKASQHMYHVHNPNVKQICEQCGAELSSKTTYEAHLRRHTGEKPFQCHLCDKAFPCASSRYIHVRDAHKRLANGKVCKQYKCDECDKDFKNYMTLYNHISNRHPEKTSKRKIGGTFQRFCKLCHDPFYKIEDLEEHMSIVHQQVPKTNRNAVTGKAEYRCDQCPKVLLHINSLRRHKLIFHPSDGVRYKKFFGCTLCDKEYSLKASIKSHLRKQHTDALPVELLTEDTVTAEDGSVNLNIDRFLIRKT